jgi:hypothetical protein
MNKKATKEFFLIRNNNFLFLLFFFMISVVLPIKAMANVFIIDPSQSYVYYGSIYGPNYGPDSEKFPLSGTFSYQRADGYFGEWGLSQIHIEAIDIQPSSLPYGPLNFADEYHGVFNGASFGGSDNMCDYWVLPGECWAIGGNFYSYLSGTLNQKTINIKGSIPVDSDHSYFFEIKSTASTHQSIGNFKINGNTDILWRHIPSGMLAVWYMDGDGGISNIAILNSDVDTNWQISGVGDFNNDGNTDILWRHMPSGSVAVWYMNGGGSLSHTATLYPNIDLSWQIAGVGDFNNDGNTDILWRHLPSGMVAIWYMDGDGRISNTAVIYSSIDLNWQISGVGDFNNDGNVDILWRHLPSGIVAVWYMDGAGGISGIAILNSGVDTNWQISGVGDFNNDGNVDILWRHTPSGMVAVWYMDGAGVISGTKILYSEVDTSWKIVGP